MLTQCLLSKAVLKYYNYNYLLTEKEVLMGNLRSKPCPIDQAIVRSIQQGQGLRLNIHEYSRLISTSLIHGYCFAFFLQLANQSMHYISYKNKT